MEAIRNSVNKGSETGMGALGYAYETGRGVKENVKQAVEWYKKSADKGSYESMANYAILVVENMMDEFYPQAYTYLQKCFKKDLDNCKFAVSLFVLYNGRFKTQKGMGKTCEELVVYLNQGAINIYTKHILKKSKQLYVNMKFEESLAEIVKAYTLGSPHSLKSFKVLIEKKKLQNLNLRLSKRNTLLSFDGFNILRKE
jgi:TPR repeat protein